MVRRHVLVRKSRIIGLGKEANRIETGRVLGQHAVGGRAKTYVNWKGRLLAMGRAEAERLGLPWTTVMRWKGRLRLGLPLANGHGGHSLSRLRAAFARAIGDRGGVPDPTSSKSPQRCAEKWSPE